MNHPLDVKNQLDFSYFAIMNLATSQKAAPAKIVQMEIQISVGNSNDRNPSPAFMLKMQSISHINVAAPKEIARTSKCSSFLLLLKSHRIALAIEQANAVRKYIQAFSMISALVLLRLTNSHIRTPIAHAAIIDRHIDTPTVFISESISAVSSADFIAVRNGGRKVTSPCMTCSPANRNEPPHRLSSRYLSLSDHLVIELDFSSLQPFNRLFFALFPIRCLAALVPAATAALTMKHAILTSPVSCQCVF